MKTKKNQKTNSMYTISSMILDKLAVLVFCQLCFFGQVFLKKCGIYKEIWPQHFQVKFSTNFSFKDFY